MNVTRQRPVKATDEQCFLCSPYRELVGELVNRVELVGELVRGLFELSRCELLLLEANS
jgi:hypothetical protein